LISVVVSTRNDGPRLGPCLGALTPGLIDGLIRDVIFADAGSTDATAEIADLTGARFLPCAGLAEAAAAARGPWLLLLSPAAVLAPDWPEAARRHLMRGEGRAGWFPCRADDGGLRAGAGAALCTLRARLLARPRPDNGLLIAKTLFAQAGAPAGHARLVRALGRRRLAPLAARVTVVASSPDRARSPA
jgi:glycosyltransferase involved in cell wall biosynthesis